MKKITFLVLAVLAFQFNYAQDTCATAVSITPGTYSVTVVDGSEIPTPECAANAADPDPRTAGEWYTYTASVDGIANITSDVAGTVSDDTRVHIYEGTCGSLTCIGGNDDISGANFLSDATFPVSSGTTYIIAWDDRWNDAAFNFTLTETSVDCSTTSPYSYDFADFNPFIACYSIEDENLDGTSWGYNNGNDVDGDTVNDGIGIIFPQAAGVAKDDWLFLPVFNGVANADYELSVTYNAFDNPGVASESFDIVVLDSPSSSASTQTVIGSYTGITQSGAGVADLLPNAYTSSATYTPTTDGDFYFAIHANTGAADSAIIMVFELAVSETLGVNDFETNTFTKNYSKTTETLTLESSNMAFTNIEVYSILGQKMISMPLSNTTETISVSSLSNGVYLAKVSINGNSKTIRFIKN